MEDKKGFDPVAVTVILTGLLMAGGSTQFGAVLSIRPGGGL